MKQIIYSKLSLIFISLYILLGIIWVLLLRFTEVHNISWLFWICLPLPLVALVLFRKIAKQIANQIVNPKLLQRFPALREEFLTPQYTQIWYLAHGEGMGYFCDKGASANEKTKHGISLLHLAAAIGDIENVRELLQYGADIHAKDDEKLTPLDYAQKYQEIQVVTLLQNILKIKPLVKIWNYHVQADLVWNSVFFALLTENDHNVFYALDKGYGLRTISQDITFLHVAAALGRLTACKTLCDFKADVLAQDKQGRTPIDWAKISKQSETLEYLTHMAKHRHEWAPGRIEYTQKEQKGN